MRRRVTFSILGTTLDRGVQPKRWSHWRPNIALCQHEDLFIDRLELIHDNHSQHLADIIAQDIQLISPATVVNSHVVNMKDPWDFAEVYEGLHDFTRNYAFDPEKEDYLVNITTGTHVAQICWFLLVETHAIPGKLLQLSPPKIKERDQDIKGRYSIIDLDLSRYDNIASRFLDEKKDATSFLKSGIETKNNQFNTLIDRIEQVAIRSKAPVLLSGPTGAGKTQLVRRIYELKKRERLIEGAFVEVNCATLRGDQAMSTLFGHVKGAFTGAQQARTGLMKAADKGMLFLDEIGELGLDEQAMVLRALEERRFSPLGSDTDVTSDFLLVAGTNKDLQRAVRDGSFREDLLARLNLWHFQLPGLCDRREDIEPNLDFELKKYAQNEGRVITFNREARLIFLNFALSAKAFWHGNFRDLAASVMRMATLSKNGRIDEELVNQEIETLSFIWQGNTDKVRANNLCQKYLSDTWQTIDQFDLVQLELVLQECLNAKTLSEAGRRLFSVSRHGKQSRNDADRLRKYLQRFDLLFEDIC